MRRSGRQQRGPRSLPGLAHRVLQQQSNQRAGLAAAGAAFWIVIAAFPTVIAVASIYGLFVNPDRVATDLGNLANDVPGSLGSFLTEQIRAVVTTDRAGISLGLIGSVIAAIWSASGGMYQLDSAIRAAYGLPPQRFIEARTRALLGAIVSVLLLGLAAIAIPAIAARSAPIAAVAGIPAALVAITLTITALYRFSVGTSLGMRAWLPGAALSATGIVAISIGFGAYIEASGRYTAVYGAFAGTVIAMLAIYFSVRVVLLGAGLNRALHTPDT